LKFALVTETFPPEINGVSMTLERLVDGLHQRGARIEVVAPYRRDRKDQPRFADVFRSVRGLPIPRYPDLRFGLPAFRQLRRAWKADPPELLHIATEGPLGWSALRVAKKLNLTVVSSFHTNFHSYGRHYGYGFLTRGVLAWLRYCHNRTRRTFVPSEDLLQKLQEEGFRNLRVFSRGVDTDLFGPHQRDEGLRLRWGADRETPVALYVGRLAAEKNIELCLKATRRMRERIPGLCVVLVGDGPERRRLADKFPEIHFAGMRTGQDLARHYASADCFLFASITETFGNVVTEAMASGLPVLAYDYAAPGRFIRPGENGLLAAYDDGEAFLRCAGEFAALRPRWHEMGEAARETIAPHAWSSVIETYYNECLRLLPSQPVPSP
jgi:glycosyltransferase involved in cell wall biosynthesis